MSKGKTVENYSTFMRDQFNVPLCLLYGSARMAACESSVLDGDSLGLSMSSFQMASSEYMIYARNRKPALLGATCIMCSGGSCKNLLFAYPYSVLVSDEATANIKQSRAGQVITAMTADITASLDMTLCSLVDHY